VEQDESGLSFFDQLGVSDNLRRIVSRTAWEFESMGDGVSYDTLADETAEGEGPFDINEIFHLPGTIGGVWSSEEKVSLTGLGLILSESAPESSHMMVNIAQMCVERKLRLRDDAKLGRDILVSEYGYSEDRALRARDLFQLLPGLSAGGRLGDDWELGIFRTALTDYKDVKTVHDLRSVLVRQARERLQLHQQTLANPPAFLTEPAFAQSFRPDATTEVESDESQEPIIFLSWSGADSRAIAAVMHGILQTRLPSCEIFFSPVSIDPGEDPMLEIFERNLLRAQVLVAILTEEASQSAWVIWEIASAWAREETWVVPLFVDVNPGDIPGPMSLKLQGMRLSERDEVDRAILKAMKQSGVEADSHEQTNEEWEALTAARNSSSGRSVAVFPANFTHRVIPLNDGGHPGSLLALLITAEAALDNCKCILTAVTGPPDVETIPVPTTLPWHPSRAAEIDVAQGATELICVARVGPFPPEALIDSTNQTLPWMLPEGAWRLDLQLTAKSHVAQLISAVITVRDQVGVLRHDIEWNELVVH
jgi:hypothetical protein